VPPDENVRLSENKGKFAYFSQIRRLKNCAIGDTVAQLKMNWRRFGGTVGARVSDPQQRPDFPDVTS